MNTVRRGALIAGVGVTLTLATVRAHDLITTRVTWSAEVNRIVQARCVSCHSPGGRAPMPLTTYKEARPWARAIKEEVLTRRMPKWHAMRGYGAFTNDPSLSAFELALIAAWVDGGAPEGPPATTATPPAIRLGDERRPDRTRDVVAPCSETTLAPATLYALRPELARGAHIGIAVRLPDGTIAALARIRDFDPRFTVTYWLRQPLTIPPGATLLVTPTSPPCRIVLTMAQP